MMKKYFKYIFTAIASLFIVVSCSDKKEYASYVKVDKASITFGAEAGTETIVITHNVGEVVAKWEGAEIGTLNIADSKVSVNVAANTTGADRVSNVIVSSKDGVYKAVTKVRQLSTSSPVTPEKDNIELNDVEAGRVVVKMTACSKNTRIEAITSEWVKAEIYPDAKELVIDFDSNLKNREARVARIILMDGDASATVTISQPAPMLYPYPSEDAMFVDRMPPMQHREVMKKVYQFEIARGSVNQSGPNENTSNHTYFTKSPTFPVIFYAFSAFDGCKEIQWHPSTIEALKDPRLHEFIKSKGYEYQFTTQLGGDIYYMNPTNQYVVNISVRNETVYFYGLFKDMDLAPNGGKLAPEFQTAPQPSFKELPLGYQTWTKRTPADVEAYELANNGTFLLTESYPSDEDPTATVTRIEYSVANDTEGLVRRGYFFIDGELYETFLVFDQMERGLYRSIAVLSLQYVLTWKFTHEFTACQLKAGFKATLTASGGTVLYNKERRVMMLPKVATYDMGGGVTQDFLQLHYQYGDLTDLNISPEDLENMIQ